MGKLRILAESQVKKLVKDEIEKRVGYLEKEIESLRKRIQILEKESKLDKGTFSIQNEINQSKGKI